MPRLDEERYRRAHELRLEGRIYREIGSDLGVSPERARQMVQRYREFLRGVPLSHAARIRIKRDGDRILD